MKKTRRMLFVAPLLVMVSMGGALAPAVSADDVESLISSMEAISQDANAKNEAVKQLELDLTAGEESLRSLQSDVDRATQEADEAKSQENIYRSEINRLAASKYRGAVIDPLTNAVSAENPQNAIDRAAYMSVLTRNAQAALNQLSKATEHSAVKRGSVTRAIAEAKFKQAELERQHGVLLKEQEELKTKTEDLRKQVESLSREDRLRWEAKNGPVAYSLDGVVGSNPEGMGALQAAMTKLGSPYGWGAVGPSQFDCSGLVYWSYQQQGKSLPRTSQAQMAGGTPVSRSELQPGDVVGYYPGATHVGIYAGNGMLVHASDYGIPVQVVPVDSMPFYGARRY